MATYEIIVDRKDLTKCSGSLRFIVDGSEQFETSCWEDPTNLIPAKDYSGCSATIMTSKKFESVYLPDDQTGKVGIFVHQGSKPEHSDGCIVCSAARVSEMYKTIDPKDGRNVVVRVTNPS